MRTKTAKDAKHVRRVLHVVYPGVTLLDVTGPLQVFHNARRAAGGDVFASVLVSSQGGPVRTDVGIPLQTRALDTVRVGPSDLILVPGGREVLDALDDTRLVAWLRSRASRAGGVASTCTGAFLLGEAGLLDGRRAVTHWDDCDELQRRYPDARVEEDPIFVEDDGVWTSAGVTAGIDLALALVENELGRAITLDLARRLVVYSKRAGGQSQFSNRLQQQLVDESESFEELHEWVGRNLRSDLRVEHLAARVHMSPRTFHRAYTKETGMTPARMVSRVRVEAARARLEETRDNVSAVARECGFGTEEQMRRTFVRELGLPPSAYRQKWSSAS